METDLLSFTNLDFCSSTVLNSKLRYHFNHFSVFSLCSCVLRIIILDTVSQSSILGCIFYVFVIFSCTPRCKRDGGSTLWGLRLLACCIIVNKMSAFCVEMDSKGNISRRGDWNSLTVWTRFFFYFMSTLRISWQLRSWSRFIMNEYKHCAAPLVTYLLRLWIIFFPTCSVYHAVIYWTVE